MARDHRFVLQVGFTSLLASMSSLGETQEGEGVKKIVTVTPVPAPPTPYSGSIGVSNLVDVGIRPDLSGMDSREA